MAIDVVMPQMGESIAEGTVVRWIKKPGDKVERDEPLLEISTDKVDAEIPSPAAGTLSEVLVKEGQTVAVNSVVARIAGEGDAAAPAPKPAPEPAKTPAPAPKPAPSVAQAIPPAPEPARSPAPTPKPPAPAAPAPPQQSEKVASLEERRRTKSSPLVRKIAAENNVDIAQVQGSGVSGRVTKNDILGYIQQPSAPQEQQQQKPAQEFKSGESIRLEPLSVMRKRIAQHMVMSKQTSAHVTTVFEIDFTNIEKLRQQYKNDYASRGAKLTYLPFIVQAIVAGLRDFPIVNASMDENNIIYHRDYNIGIAVALDWGLIVPVVKNADEKNILGLAKTINDLGERARNKKLSPDDVQGGTFTITNPGVYGGLFGTPIINQPQVAILGVGGVKKRPVIVETDDGDFIAIRSMCILSLTFDHRLIDGAVADQFMAKVKSVLEAGQFTV
jgi:pyruvate dehydrogenase E2 component (dihydrolipoamide acetyltransferase)